MHVAYEKRLTRCARGLPATPRAARPRGYNRLWVRVDDAGPRTDPPSVSELRLPRPRLTAIAAKTEDGPCVPVGV